MTARPQAQRPHIAAHRGGMGEEIASSIVAFRRAAVDLGVDLELDVHPTEDCELVVFHDERLELTTNLVGSIHDYSLEELRSTLDLSNGMASNPVGIATLGEVLAISGESKVSIDIKEDLGPASWIEESVGRLVQEYDMEERAVVASFLDPPLARFRRLFPAIPTAASSAEAVRWYQEFHSRVGSQPPFQVLSLPTTLMGSQYLTPELVASAHHQGLEVWVWTVNEEEDLRRMQTMDVDVVVTDYPAKVLEFYRG
ncbi:glycerophosphodiester phosphodiesterase family protein [Ferrimicrobium sp.]|uniref:glycerophosphodiester phosphodiesterase n=1 Tax=Ferrimicrobium sp. TaxID=2926050 RepID=UPI0026390ACA|nr:glycerophosphodiester phosphodiesterase family protein [Ferrimicrobium sp.]